MNRKRLAAGGIVLVAFAVLLILCVTSLVFAWGRLTKGSQKLGQSISIAKLAYCSDDQTLPCVVSFGSDNDGNLLVNLLLPDHYPVYYLQITQNNVGEVSNYSCRKVASTPNSVYCVGPMMPPGQILHLMLVTIKDDTLLAVGDLSLVGMAFPTLSVVTPIPSPSPEEFDTTVTPTEFPDFLLTTPTPPQFPLPTLTPTSTQSSYPNPSYP
ncbi:MAG: hypothetical protein IPP66_02425 [Anaerolineales bacterium]|nr:hypothetical protein [Anaerolineales bacterium]